MRRARLVVDGLWLALCPSFRFNSLSPSTLHVQAQRLKPNQTCFRSISIKALKARRAHQYVKEQTSTSEVGHSQTTAEQHGVSDGAERDRGKPALLARMNHLWGQGNATIEEQPISALYELLHLCATLEKSVETRYLIDQLVHVRHEPPNTRLYSALILANVIPETGSIARVHALLHEMETEGITLDEGICHDVLKVRETPPRDVDKSLTPSGTRRSPRPSTTRRDLELHGKTVVQLDTGRKTRRGGCSPERSSTGKGSCKSRANAEGW